MILDEISESTKYRILSATATVTTYAAGSACASLPAPGSLASERNEGPGVAVVLSPE